MTCYDRFARCRGLLDGAETRVSRRSPRIHEMSSGAGSGDRTARADTPTSRTTDSDTKDDSNHGAESADTGEVSDHRVYFTTFMQ